MFCEDNFSKRRHDVTSEIGAWFCRGLFQHKSDKEGGCNYWKREGTLSLNDCTKECTEAGFGGFGNQITGERVFVTETDMCKAGCTKGGTKEQYINYSVLKFSIYFCPIMYH